MVKLIVQSNLYKRKIVEEVHSSFHNPAVKPRVTKKSKKIQVEPFKIKYIVLNLIENLVRRDILKIGLGHLAEIIIRLNR